MNVIDTLITDRTPSDVEAGADKGYYNAADLNRVEAAMEYVAARLRAAGCGVSVTAKTDWTMSDIPTPADMDRYLSNLATLRGALTALPATPSVPDDMSGLTWQEANDIERILADVDALVTSMSAVYLRSGVAWAVCGGPTFYIAI